MTKILTPTQAKAKGLGANCEGPPQGREERPTPPWLTRARELRRLKWSYRRIANEVDRTYSVVYNNLVGPHALAKAAKRTQKWKENKT